MSTRESSGGSLSLLDNIGEGSFPGQVRISHGPYANRNSNLYIIGGEAYSRLRTAAQYITESLTVNPEHSRVLFVCHEDELSFANAGLQASLGEAVTMGGVTEDQQVTITSFQELNTPVRNKDGQLQLLYEQLPEDQFQYIVIDRYAGWKEPSRPYARIRAHFGSAFALNLEPDAERQKLQQARQRHQRIELKRMLGTKHPNSGDSIAAPEWQDFAERISADTSDVNPEESKRKAGAVAGAKEELVLRCLRRVYGIAQAYAARLDSSEFPIEDLFQSGVERLITSIDTFETGEATMPLPLSMAASMHHGVGRDSAHGLAVSRHYYQRKRQIDRARAELTDEQPTDTTISDEMIAERIDVKVTVIRDVRFATANLERREILDFARKSDRIASSADTHEMVARGDSKTRLHDVLEAHLPYNHAVVLSLCWGLHGISPQTLEVVGGIVNNLTKARIGQIERASLEELQHLAATGRLKEIDGTIKPRTEPEASQDKRERMQEYLVESFRGERMGWSRDQILSLSLARIMLDSLKEPSLGAEAEPASLAKLASDVSRKVKFGHTIVSRELKASLLLLKAKRLVAIERSESHALPLVRLFRDQSLETPDEG